jgi:tRNA nucleotidyltransferase/poly(A) polymerase
MNELFLVGGAVRDKIMGIQPKDMDYVFVLDDEQRAKCSTSEDGYNIMKKHLTDNGYKIFIEHPEYYTLKARFPNSHKEAGLTADFVVARKEIGYTPGTRSPILVLGSLRDDLIRRDFTINSLAEDEDGNVINLFDGVQHISDKILKTPISVDKSFSDDPLRILRAIRFSITKDMFISREMSLAINNFDYNDKMKVVSVERIQAELLKCFKHDTAKALIVLYQYPMLYCYIFDKTPLWLMPTLKLK